MNLPNENVSPRWHVYILECSDGSYYTGMAVDLDRRLQEHLSSRGGHYTKTIGVVRLLWNEAYTDCHAAAKREQQIKGWTRRKKEALIRGDFILLKKL